MINRQEYLIGSMMKIFLILSLLFTPILVLGQNCHERYAADVETPENIVTAVLESISGDKGEERDWARFRNLFLPTAQLNAVFHRNDSSWVKINTISEFIDKAGTWYIDNGFHEYAYKNKVDVFGNIAHVFQSYGASIANEGEIERGINSFQLVYDKGRWWIVNLIWDSETETVKIPDQYLS